MAVQLCRQQRSAKRLLQSLATASTAASTSTSTSPATRQGVAAMQQRINRLSTATAAYSRSAAHLMGFRRQYSTPSNSTNSSRALLNAKARTVVMRWADGSDDSVFPIAWLRDNCQCTSCFHPDTLSRLQLMENFDPGITVQGIYVNDPKEEVSISWTDGHTSTYKFKWLKPRSFDRAAQTKRLQDYSGKHRLWGAGHEIARISFEQVMQSDSQLLQLLQEMERHGLCILEGAPSGSDAAQNTVLHLCNRIAYPLQNNYGDNFVVKSKLNPSNLAYTPARLGLHVDLPYYRELPGVQMLHCISQSDKIVGGDNFFSDGFFAANLLKSTDEEAFKILSFTLVDFYDYGSDFLKDFHLLYRQKVISLNERGEYEMICYNNQVRDTYLNIPLDQVQPFYDSLKKYDTLLHGDKCAVFAKLKDGEIVMFDNRRVLHGRNSYQVTGAAERHLQGSYLRWDEVYSRMRRLQETLSD